MNNSYQSESSECGLACISIALERLGSSISLAELRRKHVVSARGLTVKDILKISASVNLVGRAVRCELEELVDLKCPAILHWKMQHFVVLEEVKGKYIYINDPANGRSRIAISTASGLFTGIAIELSAAPEFKRRREKSPLSLWSWFRLGPTMHSSLVQILMLSLLLQAYIVASPFYMQLAIDQAALKGDRQLLISLAVGFVLFGLFNQGATILRGIISIRLSSLLNWDMTLRLFHHMLRLPLPWFQRRRLADILSRFDSIAPVRELISGSLVSTVIDGALAIVTVIMMFVFSVNLAIVVLAGLTIYVAIRLAALQWTIRLGMDVLTAKISESGKRIETIRAIQTIKVMAAENAREIDWANRLASTIKSEQAQKIADLSLTSIHNTVDMIVTILLIYMGAREVISGTMTIGLLYAFMAYQRQFSDRAGALFDQLMHWRLTDIYSYRLSDIVLSAREHGIDDDKIGQPSIVGALEFRDLGFSYSPHETPIFSRVSFKVEPGEFIAIVGPSGAGKSTLLKVLCGLYPATTGNVLLDGRSLDSWGPRAVRSALGVVMQDDELLSGTVTENVSFFDSHVDIDLVWFCLQQAALAEDILKMPMRTDTHLGDMGGSLSGGQKQRLLLARALYRKPRILILDEATSHLDVERESQINLALKSLSITRIVVAHRPQTIAAADRVIGIAAGNLVFDRRSFVQDDVVRENSNSALA